MWGFLTYHNIPPTYNNIMINKILTFVCNIDSLHSEIMSTPLRKSVYTDKIESKLVIVNGKP